MVVFFLVGSFNDFIVNIGDVGGLVHDVAQVLEGATNQSKPRHCGHVLVSTVIHGGATKIKAHGFTRFL